MRIALAQMNPTIGALQDNYQKIIHSMTQARKSGADLVVFPEMALCGYPPEDLLLLPSFIAEMVESLKKIISHSKNITVIVGCVRENPYAGEKRLFNSAALIQNGELVGFHDKLLLPEYDVFSERRYFEPGGHVSVWSIEKQRVAITICEDIWQHAHAIEYADYQRDPINELKAQAPDLLINISASPYYFRRLEVRLEVCKRVTQTLHCPMLFCNQVGANDSLIFDGYSLFLNAQGDVLQVAKGFQEDLLLIDSQTTTPGKTIQMNAIEDLFHSLVLGVRDYFSKLGWKKACLGLSGGIDSSVVAVIAKEALGQENVLGVVLPSRFSPSQSMKEAHLLAKNLEIPVHEISIESPFQTFLDLLEPYFEKRSIDVTEENMQSRIRGIILMALSNKLGYLLLNTGNKSEMAMGYTTLYGDMCGGLGVLNDVTKAQVYLLAQYMNRKSEIIPQSVLTKAPSAELTLNQKDSDSLPPYSTIDQVVSSYIEEYLSVEEISEQHHLPLVLVKELVRKIHLNEYKRRQAPLGLRVTKKAFTVGRRFPIVQHWNMK